MSTENQPLVTNSKELSVIEVEPLENLEREEDLRIAITRGDSEANIAASFKLTLDEVAKHIKRYRAKWLGNLNNISKEEAKAEAIYRLDYIFGEYAHAWKRSQQGITTTRIGGLDFSQTTTNPGEKKYLEGMQWCTEKKLQLLDVNTTGNAPTTPGATTPMSFNLIQNIAQGIPTFQPESAANIAAKPIEIESVEVK